MNRLVQFFAICFLSLNLLAQTTAVSSTRQTLLENQTIYLKMGETCTITLDEKNKGQHAWAFSFSENSILYKKSESFSEGKRTFVFATAKAGEATITMTLMNRQTGSVSKTAPKNYKVSVAPSKAQTTMAAVSNKPTSANRPIPAMMTTSPAPYNYSNDDKLYAKAEATNEGYYVPTTRGVSRGAMKPEASASVSAAAPISAQPTISMAVSQFHTDVQAMSLFDKNVVAENEVFTINIEENIPTGKWTYVIDKSSIQLVDEEVFDKSFGLASKSKLHSYKFKATQAGVYDILFHVFSTENHTINKYITYTVEVR